MSKRQFYRTAAAQIAGHISKGEAIIARSQEIIEEKRTQGVDPDSWERLLKQFLDLQNEHRKHYRRVLLELEQFDGDSSVRRHGTDR
jgi:hypothetical protein